MNYKKIKIEAELLYRFIKDDVDEHERQYVNEWLKNDDNRKFFFKLTDENYFYEGVNEILDVNTNAAYYLLSKKIQKKKNRNLLIRISSVAAVFLIGILISQLYFEGNKIEDVSPENILLGHNDITLRTYTGETLVVTDEQKDSLMKTCGIKAIEGDPALTRRKNQNVTTEQVVQYNTLEIPKGREFFIVLADGTKVWLNSNTTFRFPADFNGEIRKVYLEGEAFFEVKKSENKKFIVESAGAQITVLGTSFNVNSYNPQEATTTLLEGSVRISKGEVSEIIKPGQQAVMGSEQIHINNVDVNDFVAWKSGYLVFRSVTLDKIFEGLSHWYDFEFQIDDKELNSKRFTTKLYKKNTLDSTLQILETTGEFKIKRNGKRIIVMP